MNILFPKHPIAPASGCFFLLACAAVVLAFIAYLI